MGLLLLTACGTDHGSTSAEPASQAEAVIQLAEQAEVGAEQMAILEDGDVTYDEYETAMNRAFECMRTAGFAVTVTGTNRQNGTTVLDFSVQGTTSDTDLATQAGRSRQEACYVEEARFVDAFWQTASDEVVAFEERRASALEPLLRECLASAGADVPTDASFVDLVHVASDLTSKNRTDDCIGEIGFSTWDG
ncbi:hypothetical protein [Cellulomonas fimi]|uniref:hypothetical protein n=1 Tax=Cellulomonas fimi TaxID=1708 RepID=UPI0002D28324|nr:hypothetical protein [Cellulomonas fimi]NNH07791.1 hypothetical protein [Cellulomonas fimi]